MKSRLKLIIVFTLVTFVFCGCFNKTEKPEQLKIMSLKGPTTMGIVNMMYDDSLKGYKDIASFDIVSQADEIVTAVVKGETDIALVPSNVASVLYKKTEGGIKVIDVNTLGVLYIVSKDDTVKSVADFKGKKLIMTGKGTTPDYVLQYLLKQNGLDISDLTVVYASEATEVISQMASDEESLGLLPQPFVTTAVMKDENLKVVLDLNEEWNKVNEGSIVTGVTIVRKDFLEKYPDAVEAFLTAHKDSVNTGLKDIDTTAARIEEKGIVKAAVAKQAYEKCNITIAIGDYMKKGLSQYLEILYEMDPASVGGQLPDDDFYYIGR